MAGDPLAHPRDLAAAGRAQDAVAELNADNAKLGKLLSGLQMHQQSITNAAALGEMQRRIGAKRAAIRAEIRKLTPRAPEPTASGGEPKPDKDAAVDSAAQAAKQEEIAKREERNAKIESLIPSLLTNRERERSHFAAVYEEFKKEDTWLSKPDFSVITENLNQLKPLYEQWDQSIAELRAVYTERGEIRRIRANQYAPNRAEWRMPIYAKAFH